MLPGLGESPEWAQVAFALRQRRLDLGWTFYKLQEVSGCDRRSLNGWERGTHEPSAGNLMRWAKGLGLNLRLD